MGRAARVSDLHTCPASSPLPHVGGLITGPGVSTVLIGSMHAAVEGTVCTCVLAPPNPIASGSTTVKIGNMPAARMGDPTAHGGSIVMGCSTVLIGG